MPETTAVPYPEYPALAERARLEAPPFVSRGILVAYQEVIGRRGRDWCTAVLGRGFPGLDRISVREAQLLLLADAEDLTPPLPADVVAARAAAVAHQAAIADRRRQLEERDRERWAVASADCTVPLEVRPNVSGRRYGTGTAAGPLRHAVPLADVESGSLTRPRRHPVGRAVCETVARAKPRRLGGPTPEPVTCVGCLKLVPTLRPAAD